MCWSMEASMLMTAAGAGAAAVTYKRGDPPAIWLTIGYFTVMEGLQVAGYAVLDQCGTGTNRAVTLASYLHIVFQPFFINAFAMMLVPEPVRRSARRWVYALCAVSAGVMLLQLIPVDAWGACTPGASLCAAEMCTVSGDWHIAWDVPYNGLLASVDRLMGTGFGFPTYMVAVFILPLFYGAWRFTMIHAVVGPILASALTSNPNEMPAIWCLFSIFIIFVGLSLRARMLVGATTWWGKVVS